MDTRSNKEILLITEHGRENKTSPVANRVLITTTMLRMDQKCTLNH
uniref:Uncharacterized protein n=1 Tax=Anguilla anguilla TaxID=7936 RepID=A0A0E9V090_ANGAN